MLCKEIEIWVFAPMPEAASQRIDVTWNNCKQDVLGLLIARILFLNRLLCRRNGLKFRC